MRPRRMSGASVRPLNFTVEDASRFVYATKASVVSPRALEESMRPRLQSSACARPLNFTVRGRKQIRLCNESDKGEEPRQRPFV